MVGPAPLTRRHEGEKIGSWPMPSGPLVTGVRLRRCRRSAWTARSRLCLPPAHHREGRRQAHRQHLQQARPAGLGRRQRPRPRGARLPAGLAIVAPHGTSRASTGNSRVRAKPTGHEAAPGAASEQRTMSMRSRGSPCRTERRLDHRLVRPSPVVAAAPDDVASCRRDSASARRRTRRAARPGGRHVGDDGVVPVAPPSLCWASPVDVLGRRRPMLSTASRSWRSELGRSSTQACATSDQEPIP